MAQALVSEQPDCFMQTHLSENHAEIAQTRALFPWARDYADVYERYGLLGCTHYHENCRDNLHAGLAALGIHIPYTPDSLNLFMNIPWRQDGALEWGNCLCKPGDSVTFRAEMDCIVAFSACPQDLLPINNGITTEAHFEVM